MPKSRPKGFYFDFFSNFIFVDKDESISKLCALGYKFIFCVAIINMDITSISIINPQGKKKDYLYKLNFAMVQQTIFPHLFIFRHFSPPSTKRNHYSWPHKF